MMMCHITQSGSKFMEQLLYNVLEWEWQIFGPPSSTTEGDIHMRTSNIEFFVGNLILYNFVSSIFQYNEYFWQRSAPE